MEDTGFWVPAEKRGRLVKTYEKAMKLYKEFGFKVEGILKKDKILSDGKYYDTVVMGRFRDGNLC